VLVNMIFETEMAMALAPSTGALTEWDEQDVVARAKSGSETAFDQLVERHERRVLHLAQNITRNHEDAEDVVQNAFVKAFQNLPDFRGDSTFYTWLVRITVNEALMKIRRSRSHKEVSIDESKEMDDSCPPLEIEDWGPNPERRCSQQELQRILAATINELEPGYRTVFQLRDVEGFSTEETAQVLALSPSAVKTRLRRARMSLRESLDKHFRPTCVNRNQHHLATACSKAPMKHREAIWKGTLKLTQMRSVDVVSRMQRGAAGQGLTTATQAVQLDAGRRSTESKDFEAQQSVGAPLARRIPKDSAQTDRYIHGAPH
jgi:RNA polymerase sigma-70 factor, ECF subfamily